MLFKLSGSIDVVKIFASINALKFSFAAYTRYITNIKQIHNNIICSIDIYIDAVDLKNDDKHIVCIHCNRVQIMTNLVLSINIWPTTHINPPITKHQIYLEMSIKTSNKKYSTLNVY